MIHETLTICHLERSDAAGRRAVERSQRSFTGHAASV